MSGDGPAERTIREERSLTPMRKTIANRLQESYQEAVHVTVNRTIDAEELLSAADAAEATAEGADPTVTDIVLCALSDALAAHPAFNATFEDGTHRLYEEQNVGVATTIEGRPRHARHGGYRIAVSERDSNRTPASNRKGTGG
ncbi:2-oxo acid dehydrogenase subunit E2 [Haloarcula sp. 1CSR25-25]|uniref:2-oxo acid dehydrogenase subunit E2 n=1 Tax=Haloarcula sp. 1CSR25-25 TaxID=2862545 RepID=UPI002895B7F7|nr:2-oxo acid dehydrogenase subunit E2 [Haloarcula sp. 1CSR25-25]MDT3435742.1 2-oxo acid dehydrogenase subunit E2 [Haloarcula sp. 1CSR25-25]